MQSVVITGTSSGIGWGAAKVLLDRGFRVFGSVRKQADADRLKEEFGINFTPLLFDVTDEAQVLAAARDVRAELEGETLADLVNNAGEKYVSLAATSHVTGTRALLPNSAAAEISVCGAQT